MPRRRICFVTGTRAEYGLMRSTMRAIADHPKLQLQLVATGMHLSRSRGRSLDEIRKDGWKIDAIVPWADQESSQTETAQATGVALSDSARVFEELKSDIVLVVGDRVEAFAAAAAAHIGGQLVAHVHGGDRALGLVDDSLRHAITKLAHIHFPATRQSAQRIIRLGEDIWRVFQVGSPGLDDIRSTAASADQITRAFPGLIARRYALLVYHPKTADEDIEARHARLLLHAINSAGVETVVIIHPNNDPGSGGIARAWDSREANRDLHMRRNVSRSLFLGLLRDCALMVGNSSSGIIEAASFGMPVLDVGDRQKGRERGKNVIHSSMSSATLARAIRKIWNKGSPIRFSQRNIYGRGNAGRQIASILARIKIDQLRRKLISY